VKRSPDDAPPGSTDREISLGAPAILGIFFALALLCACFFGFGYSMGRKSAQSATADTAAANADTTGSSAAKPAAGSLASQPAAGNDAQPATDNSAASTGQTDAATDTAQPTPTPVPTKPAANPADSMIVGDKPAARTPSPTMPTPTKPASAKPAAASQQPSLPAGSFMVQVAAVSSEEVADIELDALKKKGYNVSIRHEPEDKLLHVQIGPFASRKDAQSMCQRVLADGFNAIVK
jgi:cell division septation protein DedD